MNPRLFITSLFLPFAYLSPYSSYSQKVILTIMQTPHIKWRKCFHYFESQTKFSINSLQLYRTIRLIRDFQPNVHMRHQEGTIDVPWTKINRVFEPSCMRIGSMVSMLCSTIKRKRTVFLKVHSSAYFAYPPPSRPILTTFSIFGVIIDIIIYGKFHFDQSQNFCSADA